MLLTPEDRIYDAAEHPRIFEVGREGAVDLSVVDVEGVRTIHPLRADLEHTDNQGQLKQGISPSSATVMALVASRAVDRDGTRPGPISDSGSGSRAPGVCSPWSASSSWSGTAVFLTTGGVTALMAHHDEGEPFSWTAGVSIWPGQWLRLLAVMLCLVFLVKGSRDLIENSDHLTEEFSVPCRSRPSLPIHPEDILDQSATGLSFGRHQNCHSPSIKPGPGTSMRHDPLQRTARVLVLFLLYGADHDFPGSAGSLDEEMIHPCRGWLSCQVDCDHDAESP